MAESYEREGRARDHSRVARATVVVEHAGERCNADPSNAKRGGSSRGSSHVGGARRDGEATVQ